LQIVINNPVATTAPVQSAANTTIPTAVITSSTLARTTTVSTVAKTGATTTTTTIASQTTTTVPTVSQVVTGEAAVTVDGEKATSTLERNNNQIVISVGDMKATVSAVDNNGGIAPLDSNGNISLRSGDRVAIKLGGFTPGTPVEMWMFSTPHKIGSAKVNAKGELDTVIVIPKDAPVGDHRVAIVMNPKGGKAVTFTLGIAVKKFSKESRMLTWLIVTPLVAAVLSAMFLPPALRRRRKKIA
jgi:hypothetical protein